MDTMFRHTWIVRQVVNLGEKYKKSKKLHEAYNKRQKKQRLYISISKIMLRISNLDRIHFQSKIIICKDYTHLQCQFRIKDRHQQSSKQNNVKNTPFFDLGLWFWHLLMRLFVSLFFSSQNTVYSFCTTCCISLAALVCLTLVNNYCIIYIFGLGRVDLILMKHSHSRHPD